MRRKTSWILAASVAALVAIVAIATAAVPPNIARTVEAQRRLAAERPNDPAVFNDLGNVLLLASQPAEAEAAYRKAIELDPNKTTALYNLALLLQQRGELGEAMELYRRVVKLEPGHAWAHYQIGTLHERWGHESRAIDEYAAAFALDPQLAFPEVNPHIVDNKLVTQAMMRAYQSDFTPPQAPRIYDDPSRIATLLVPPSAAAQSEKDQVANQPQQQNPQAHPPAAAGKAQPGQVLRERDLQRNPSGQATPQGAGRGMPGAGVPGSRQTPPRGLQQWNRPEPQIQEVPTEVPEEQPAPVITPPPGGVYYRPGIQSTGRLGMQLAPEPSPPRPSSPKGRGGRTT